MVAELLIILLLVFINGIFSMSEIAVVSSRKTRLELLARRGSVAAKNALILHNSPNKFLSTVQVGITLVGILNGMFGGATIKEGIKLSLDKIPALQPYSEPTALTLVLIGITFLSLVFGELLPKRIGMANPEGIARLVATPMMFISKITAPFIWLLTSTTDVIIRMLNIKIDESKVTEEEIKAIVEEGAAAGSIEGIEQEIVENVFHLGDKRISSLMTHHGDISWIDVHATETEVKDLIRESPYSFFPVCDEELDNILGIISIKDILKSFLDNKKLDIKSLIRQTNYLPENLNAYNALERFKETKYHHGIVVDEFGSVQGIVTINDVFDALVGDVFNEKEMGFELTEREDGSWFIDGQYPFDDFMREFDIDDDKVEDMNINTISGLVLHELKRVPKAGDRFNWHGYSFEIVDMDAKRIDKIWITKLDGKR
jgi:putative hemolysin